MKRYTVLSMEQALSLPSATLRFAQLGWRVIRVEATPSGNGLPGDPNRYIGSRIADDDRRSYFIAPNVGKEAIALNLKDQTAQEVLRRLITALDVDVFCCNTVPSRYQSLGIDYAASTGTPVWAVATLKLIAERSLSAIARPPLSWMVLPSATSAGDTCSSTGEISSKSVGLL